MLTSIKNSTCGCLLELLSTFIWGVHSCILESRSYSFWCHCCCVCWYKNSKKVTLDILWPDRSLFTCINCLWYSALNKANGVSSNSWRMCVQCGGKQHTSTFFDFMYSMNPKLKRCNLCMSSSNRTLLFLAKIFFSVKNRTKCSPNSWNSLPLIYPVADPQIIYPVGAASHHSGLILFALKITSGA